MKLTIETEREEDGRWIAEVPELPGVMVYGSTREEAVMQVEALALRVLAENGPTNWINQRQPYRPPVAAGDRSFRRRCPTLAPWPLRGDRGWA